MLSQGCCHFQQLLSASCTAGLLLASTSSAKEDSGAAATHALPRGIAGLCLYAMNNSRAICRSVPRKQRASVVRKFNSQDKAREVCLSWSVLLPWTLKSFLFGVISSIVGTGNDKSPLCVLLIVPLFSARLHFKVCMEIMSFQQPEVRHSSKLRKKSSIQTGRASKYNKDDHLDRYWFSLGKLTWVLKCEATFSADREKTATGKCLHCSACC